MSEKKRGGCCSWILIPLVSILLFAMIDSCSSDPVTSGTPSTVYTTTTTTTVSSTTVTGSSTTVNTTSSQMGTTTTTTTRVTTTTTAAKNNVFGDRLSLSQYLQAEQRAGKNVMTFVYTGNTKELEDGEMCRMLATYFTSYTTKKVSGGVEYTLTVTDYPGDRVVRAHRSGNTSSLSSGEKQLLDKARQIVNTAKAQTNSQLELELALVDWLCDNVVYLTASTDVNSSTHINRPLTAYGALIDGSANCQGYTDGFYLLASIAGFEVDRQYMPGHVTNSICLDGKWYIVDATHCDGAMSVQDNIPCYYLFNAGMDRVSTYSWEDYLNRRPYAATSSSAYYYNFAADGSAHGYKKTFSSLAEASKSVVQAYRNGRTEQHIMVLQKELDGNDFISAVDAAAKAAGVRVQYTVWHRHAGNFTYYYVKFK